MEGETGKEGEAGMTCFPLVEFSLLGSIRPSHIVPTEMDESKDRS